MRRILIVCLLAVLAAACSRKEEETATLDPVEAARKAVEDASTLPDVSIDIEATPGADLARHLVDKWAVYGETPDNYAMAESIVMIDDLPPEAKSVGVKGTAGFSFQGAGPHLQNVMLAYAFFDGAGQAEQFISNLSDSNAGPDGIVGEQIYPIGAPGGPQLNFRCALVPDSGNAIACYYQDFTGQVVTTLLFMPGPALDDPSPDIRDALAIEDVQTRVFGFAEASLQYLVTVTN